MNEHRYDIYLSAIKRINDIKSNSFLIYEQRLKLEFRVHIVF